MLDQLLSFKMLWYIQQVFPACMAFFTHFFLFGLNAVNKIWDVHSMHLIYT